MSDLFSHVRGHVHHSLSLSKKHLQAPRAVGVAGVKYLQTANMLLLASRMLCNVCCQLQETTLNTTYTYSQ